MFQFLQKFKRVTYSTAYLPEIDGLRFLAIFSVVVILHMSNYINAKFFAGKLIENEYLTRFVLNGGMGVALFFIISGFILSLPFAKWRLNNEKPVVLKYYYLRRLLRLEPPYIIALLLFFCVHVWVLQKFDFEFLFPRLTASIFYLHTIIYQSFSKVLPIAWSLEVEVQFYILAPLFCTIFIISSKVFRWTVAMAIILTSAIFWFNVWEVGHVFMFLHYFFCGILLADLYCCGVVLFRNEKLNFCVGATSLAVFLFADAFVSLPVWLLKLTCMFLLFHSVLTNNSMRKLFSKPLLASIGGMCYSIYLMHFAVVAAVGFLLLKTGWPVANHAYVFAFYLLFVLAVLIVSGIYFLLIEKPFMRPWGLHKRNELSNK